MVQFFFPSLRAPTNFRSVGNPKMQVLDLEEGGGG